MGNEHSGAGAFRGGSSALSGEAVRLVSPLSGEAVRLVSLIP